MDSNTDPGVACEMLAQNEERIGTLYGLYAEKFPEYHDLWKGLSEEEAQHARWIRKLVSWSKEGLITINKNRFNVPAIRTFTNYVDKEINNVNISIVASINALSIASYIEDSIIEHKYFEVFEGDSPELKKTLLDLASATNKHRNIIKQALKEDTSRRL